MQIFTPVERDISVAYKTKLGTMYQGYVESFLESTAAKRLRGKVQMIFTSPPFPLRRKKKYGNLNGDEYLDWLASFAPKFRELLTEDGSIVLELGNAWEAGEPVMSTLALRAMLRFLDWGDLKLCQQFICYNPARLPGPAQWVNIDRVRVKDSYTHVWWMAPTSHPKANNKNVLTAYSKPMQKLLQRQTYNAGRRPSEHKISKESFLINNQGAIPSNVLTFSNTNSNQDYLQYCRENELQPHPARMPSGLPAFFIKFLTDEMDIVLDPFAGSNTTGGVAEGLKRKWLSVEPSELYIRGSKGHFMHSHLYSQLHEQH